jgi:hypothetical protein
MLAATFFSRRRHARAAVRCESAWHPANKLKATFVSRVIHITVERLRIDLEFLRVE